ncbi:MAG TPA: helix-hairpin-helix domain-containing protein [Candidatus Omnitrophica bacterium]|nr:helix-hairpin-helix domain-containing protein [Candidatus Omnitrophota bacterium]
MLELNLTRQEKNTLLVVAAAALLGLVLSFLFKAAPSAGRIYAASFDTETSRININSAGKEQLITLPGIGPKIAEKIIDYREKEGKIYDIKELKQINGIGDKKIENMKPFLIIDSQ